MQRYDFSPLFYARTIGLDRLAQMLANEASRMEPGYPPFNIEAVEDDKYRITIAVAGFDGSELDVVSERGVLRVTGRKAKDQTQRTFLHRGLAYRDFEQAWQLTDHVKVVGAKLDNGLLHIDLVREVPEEYKPRKIAIAGVNAPVMQQIEAQAA